MKPANDLPKCPFCGCCAWRHGGGNSSRGRVPYKVRCASILCGVEVEAHSREEADEKWSQRVPQERRA